jgi:hypothetical protein
MDSGLTIRPVAIGAETAFARAATPELRAAVATTLSPSQSVTAAAETNGSAGYDPALSQNLTREVILDPQTREVIFRVIDVRSGQVQRQVPDAALMRLRAYLRAEADGKAAKPESQSESTA